MNRRPILALAFFLGHRRKNVQPPIKFGPAQACRSFRANVFEAPAVISHVTLSAELKLDADAA